MPVDCTPNALAAEASCFLCAPPNVLEAIKTYLLCQLLKNYDATMQCDVKSLTAAATCFLCADARVLQAIQTQLLCNIADSISGGTGSGVACGNANPVADPGVACQLYVNVLDGTLWNWDDAAGVWRGLITLT